MEVEVGIQPNHSEDINIIGRFRNPDEARKAYYQILEKLLDDLKREEPRIFTDWDPDDVGVGQLHDMVQVRTYTSGYGIWCIEEIMESSGGKVIDTSDITVPIGGILSEFKEYLKDNPEGTAGEFIVMKKLAEGSFET